MGLRKEDFAFTLQDAQRNAWDVYHFTTDEGQQATLAFRYDAPTDKWIIGVLEKGHLDARETYAKLTTPSPKSLTGKQT